MGYNSAYCQTRLCFAPLGSALCLASLPLRSAVANPDAAYLTGQIIASRNHKSYLLKRRIHYFEEDLVDYALLFVQRGLSEGQPSFLTADLHKRLEKRRGADPRNHGESVYLLSRPYADLFYAQFLKLA